MTRNHFVQNILVVNSNMGNSLRELGVLFAVLLSAMIPLVIPAGVTDGPGQGRKDLTERAGLGQCRNIETSIGALGNSIQAVSNAVETTSAITRGQQDKLTALEARIASVEEDLRAKSEQYGTLERLVAGNLSSLGESLNAARIKVGFTVRYSIDPVTGIPANGIYKFNEIVTDVGGGYSTLTGIFTSPVTGLYVFHLNVMSTNDNSPIHLAIMKEGTPVGNVWAEGTSDVNDQGSTTVVVYMQQGQQAWVAHRAGATPIRGGPWGVFSGFLVQG